jgi:hypothetical protein
LSLHDTWITWLECVVIVLDLLSNDDCRNGLVAYAHGQADVCLKLAKRFKDLWYPVILANGPLLDWWSSATAWLDHAACLTRLNSPLASVPSAQTAESTPNTMLSNSHMEKVLQAVLEHKSELDIEAAIEAEQVRSLTRTFCTTCTCKHLLQDVEPLSTSSPLPPISTSPQSIIPICQHSPPVSCHPTHAVPLPLSPTLPPSVLNLTPSSLVDNAAEPDNMLNTFSNGDLDNIDGSGDGTVTVSLCHSHNCDTGITP